MKRLLVTLSVTAMLLAVPVSHFAFGDDDDDDDDRVTVCHVTRSISNHAGNTVSFGHYITIDEDSLDDHLAHGDQKVEGFRPHGCCAFCVTLRGDSCPVVID